MSETAPTPSRKRNVFRVRFSLAAVLFLAGMTGLLLIHALGWAESVPGSAVLLVELHDRTATAQTNQLMDRLKAHPALRPETVQYISKEEAARKLSEEDGLGDFVDDLGFNPLSNSVQGSLLAEASEASVTDSLVAELSKLPYVKEAFCDLTGQTAFRGVSSKFSWTLLGLSLLLGAVAVSLMDGAVRLALFADRHLVRNMQLVGATRDFIVRPYRLMGVRSGAIGGGIAAAALLLLELFLRNRLPELAGAASWPPVLALLLVLPVLGAGLAGLSAALAVGKYLDRRLEELA
jgi:cell division transport system permease protein